MYYLPYIATCAVENRFSNNLHIHEGFIPPSHASPSGPAGAAPPGPLCGRSLHREGLRGGAARIIKARG